MSALNPFDPFSVDSPNSTDARRSAIRAAFSPILPALIHTRVTLSARTDWRCGAVAVLRKKTPFRFVVTPWGTHSLDLGTTHALWFWRPSPTGIRFLRDEKRDDDVAGQMDWRGIGADNFLTLVRMVADMRSVSVSLSAPRHGRRQNAAGVEVERRSQAQSLTRCAPGVA